jgi:hypothetical protein
MVISNSVRFWLYLIPLIPSIIVGIFDLHYLRVSRAFGTTLKYHDTFLLLICVLIGELTDVIWSIQYYRTGTALSSTPAFCLVWAFISSTTPVSIYILVAWSSVERNIFTFHSNWFATKRKCFFFHYFPLVICILWPMIFYFIIFFIMSCDISFDYNSRLCGRYECISSNHSLSLWDSITHYIIPVCITIISSSVLFARVIYHRYRIRQKIDWDRYGRVAVHILPISAFYILLQLPPMIMYAAYSIGLSHSVAADYYSDSSYFRYWIILFTPFIYVVSLPELRTKHRKIIIYWRKRRLVRPAIIETPACDIGHPLRVVTIV